MNGAEAVRLMVVDDLAPDPRHGFGFPRARLLLDALAGRGYRLTMLGLRQDRVPAPEVLQSLAARGIAAPPLPAGGFAEYFRQCHHRFDAVWVSRRRNLSLTLPIIRGIAPHLPVVYDAEAVIAPREILRRARRGEPFPPAEAEALIHEEMQLTAEADLVVAVSHPDRALIASAGIAPVYLLGYPYGGRATTRPFEERRDVLLVHGNLNASTNTPDWLRFYVGDVLPRVCRRLRARRLDPAFRIAGYQSDLYTMPSVEPPVVGRIVRHGFVEQLRPVFDACRVLAVPTLVAGGISEKLVEALALGLPAVVSPLVAAQLDLRETDRTVLIGCDAEEFAAQLVRCYTDPSVWAGLREGGLVWARANRARFRRELARLDADLHARLTAAPRAGLGFREEPRRGSPPRGSGRRGSVAAGGAASPAWLARPRRVGRA